MPYKKKQYSSYEHLIDYFYQISLLKRFQIFRVNKY